MVVGSQWVECVIYRMVQLVLNVFLYEGRALMGSVEIVQFCRVVRNWVHPSMAVSS